MVWTQVTLAAFQHGGAFQVLDRITAQEAIVRSIDIFWLDRDGGEGSCEVGALVVSKFGHCDESA